MYDIFYVSRGDIIAKDWKNVKNKYPTAQCISHVSSFEQIKSRAFTKMFWIIWDDLELKDSFDLSTYQATKWDDQYIHVFLNGNHYDGICLFPKNIRLSTKEFEHRFFIAKKQVDIVASFPKPYDIIFISYQEPNSEENYKKLLSRFSHAKRVHGIKGIHNAHRAAATLAETEMFWVVDGDAVISEEFSFDYKVPSYEKDVVYVCRSQNPINGLEYGYGGVKLLPKKLTLNMSMSSTDMTTSISSKFKSINQISNISMFNTDAFNTWKSAFRECAKLSSEVIRGQDSYETQERLDIWCTVGKDKPFGKYAIAGARYGKEYGEKYKDDPAALSKINDFDWLEEEFNRLLVLEKEKQTLKFKDKILNFKNKLNSISSSFCAAKWKQVTVHLATGQTHSCHHPESHHIPIQEIKIDPSALHNTEFKKTQRKLMLEGIRPKECDYCWRVEDNGKVSDRIKKSMDYWAVDYIDTISKSSYTESINPSYLEVSFSNVCNFKCSYCQPDVSSQWLEEVNKHGAYPTSTKFNDIKLLHLQNKYPISESDYNPYVDAFWQWWPNLYPDLKVLRVTGGEPLLTKNTYKLLDYILENPRSDLELNINSNLCVPEKLFIKFIETVSKIQEAGAIKSFRMFTSCEAKGSQAEYIRFGLVYNQWLDNCNRILTEIPNSRLTVMSTYNALSVAGFKDFLDDIFLLKTQYADANGISHVSVDIPYLRYPPHQAVSILTEKFLPYFDSQISYMNKVSRRILYPDPGFRDEEINKLEIAKMILETQLTSSEDISQHRKDFTLFVDEHDRRRGTEFLTVFPEYEEFYKMSKG